MQVAHIIHVDRGGAHDARVPRPHLHRHDRHAAAPTRAMKTGYVDESWAREHHASGTTTSPPARSRRSAPCRTPRRRAARGLTRRGASDASFHRRHRSRRACSPAPRSPSCRRSSDEAKAKAAEAADKAAWTDKVGAYQLCKSMDKVAAAYRAGAGARPRRPRRADPTPACADPGPTWRRSRRRRRSRSRPRARIRRPGWRPAAEQQGDVGRDDRPAQVGPAIVRLTAARAPLTREIEVATSSAQRGQISIPAERALTVYVDKRELVTLMTLGAIPELLVLGYLRNQRLVERCDDIDSITVDWDVDAAAVKTRAGIERFDEKTAKRVVTTGCGQGSVFGDLMGEIDSIRLPPRASRRRGCRRRSSTGCSTPSASRRARTSRPARCTAARCSARARC